MKERLLAAGVASLLLIAGCTSGAEPAPEGAESTPGTAIPAENPTEPEEAPVYAAVGASETAGWGAGDPKTEAWPQVLGSNVLTNFRVLNLGIPGATVEDAIARELPKAHAAEPEVVTVWLNANDLLQGVSPRQYERDLDELLVGLQRAQPRQILVANTPPLASLPAYRACLPDPPDDAPFCFLGNSLPAPREMRSLVEEYNRAIERVAQRRDATIVDVFSGAVEASENGSDENLVSRDGLHPSTEGHEAIAQSFADELAVR